MISNEYMINGIIFAGVFRRFHSRVSSLNKNFIVTEDRKHLDDFPVDFIDQHSTQMKRNHLWYEVAVVRQLDVARLFATHF